MKILRTALLTLALPLAAQAASWEIDTSHSSAEFKVKHLMVTNVKGTFSKVTGNIELDEKDISKSSVTANIDASTVNTGDPKRDEHLRAPDFFDVAKFPQITFKSKKVAKGAGKDELKVTGDLTLHGVTKEVVLDTTLSPDAIKDPWGNTKRGAVATTTLNRKDFGLTWNKALETGGVVVGDEVKVELNLELNQKKNPKS
jgi:polyisoprenoid-binding protein YceI